MLCKGVYRKECVVRIVGAMDTHLTPVSMLIVCIHFFQFLTDMQRFPRDRALPHLYVDDSAWYLAHPGKVAPWSSLWGGGAGGGRRQLVSQLFTSQLFISQMGIRESHTL